MRTNAEHSFTHINEIATVVLHYIYVFGIYIYRYIYTRAAENLILLLTHMAY